MQKVLEKVKKSSGKSWSLNQFFWWKPFFILLQKLTNLETSKNGNEEVDDVEIILL